MGLIFQNIKKKNNPETAMIQIEKKFIMYSYYSFSKADDSRFPPRTRLYFLQETTLSSDYKQIINLMFIY